MHKVILCFFCFCLLAKIPPVCAQDDLYDAELAIHHAEAALLALDTSDFDQIWQSTTEVFKALHDLNTWESEHKELRQAYGVNLERNFKRIDFRTSYFHEPDGYFATIQFNSVFAHKASCTETITLKKLPSGEWQIVNISHN